MAPSARIVVTTEVSAPRKQRAHRRIPDVCGQFGVQCCNAHDFARLLDFSTDWKGRIAGAA
jgi:hypothetical protein